MMKGNPLQLPSAVTKLGTSLADMEVTDLRVKLALRSPSGASDGDRSIYLSPHFVKLVFTICILNHSSYAEKRVQESSIQSTLR
jgi:hypothetical protein